jgi:uncharacterized protein YqjF (DUF2071 family)
MIKTFLTAKWENLIMANYDVSPQLLKPYLPKGVVLDYYKDKTYVSLVGFMFKQTNLFKIPIPYLRNFEEINLRFYVKRIEGNEVKRGVVFINETVPYKLVAWLANLLYKEHYKATPTKNCITVSDQSKNINYEWKISDKWNHIKVSTDNTKDAMLPNSIEEFIFEHYYGYTKINNSVSQEYKINHPSWLVNKVNEFSIDCDFENMYGEDFSFLSFKKPYSIIVAEGSAVTVDWKRTKF